VRAHGLEPMKIFKGGSMMQEHCQRQVSMGQAPTHFGHMINCLKTFEDGCAKCKCNS
jgi:hypothetical protein